MNQIAFELKGLPLDTADTLVVWAHGWGMDRHAFGTFAEALAGRAAHLLLDFPGFGATPPPASNWGTEDYDDSVAALITPYRFMKRIIWVGHSFGCRVGIQLAAKYPKSVDGLFLLSAAGLPRHRHLVAKIKMRSRIYLFKSLKHLAPFLGLDIDRLRVMFGSPDYRAAGQLREVFVRVVRENLAEKAKLVQCPVELLYGENDTETPPELGERYAKLMPLAHITVLPRQDHYTVLQEGRHPVLKLLAEFLERT